ncbi:MAG TPA: ammonium transporter [Pleomorphomonadaceae bacterium]|nr:ammonium transporter [Pleomorphomonadaceae bacterium]
MTTSFGLTLPLLAQVPAAPAADPGHTAWMLTATALVLFMTLPGLALFYGGLVRSRNVLSVLMQCFAIACLMSLLWALAGYSLAFKGSGAWIGDLSAFGLKGIGPDSVVGDPPKVIPEAVFLMFQMTFAVITPALILGAFVERMKFSAVLVFSAVWLMIVYVPATHLVWGGGWMMGDGVIDLAGGIVVHTTAGVSALVLAAVLGPRTGFPRHLHPPHNPGMVMAGAAMLWVGWFGFNAGSQLAANGNAGMTMLATHLSAATASLAWALVERLKTGKAGLVGIVTGMVAGLATITPASGNVGPCGAVVIGALAGVVCYFMCGCVKQVLKIDDSLDVFAVHGVGGILGTLLVAFLGAEGVLGGLGINADSPGAQLWIQLKSVGVVAVWSALATGAIALILKATTGLRVSAEDEEQGLDQTAHGESAYSLES